MKTTKKIKPPGFFLQTYSGNAFYPKDGHITEIAIEDIAHALSHICRYNGHCRKFYSVAEHSVLVSRIIRQRWPNDLESIWAALLHDATEAYVGDVTTPLKVTMPQFMELEDKIALEIAKKFKITWSKRVVDRVKFADMTALSTEARILFKDVSDWSAIKSYEPTPDLAAGLPMTSEAAKKYFMKEFRKVSKEIA
jgi:5'-deoxynucleotidase YfbR-like HD superfamily hydrolase